MEDSLGVVFFHGVTVKGHVLDPAALGKKQIRSRGQRVDVGSGCGADGPRPSAVFNTYQNKSSESGMVLRNQRGMLGSLVPPASKSLWFPHTLGCCPVQSGSQRSPARCGPHTSSIPSCRGTAWARRRRSRHTWGCTGQREDGDLAVRTLSRPAGSPCVSHTEFLSSLVGQQQGDPIFLQGQRSGLLLKGRKRLDLKSSKAPRYKDWYVSF